MGAVTGANREVLIAGAGSDPAASSRTLPFLYDGSALVAVGMPMLPFATTYGVTIASGSLGY